MMDRNLIAFLAVARSRTLTEAAETLGLTQPTLTKRISSLENEYGARFFERGRQGVSMTETGKVFLPRAKRIEAEYRQSREEIDAISGAGFSKMRVGAGPLFHMTCVAALLAKLKETYPGMDLELQTQTHYDSGRLLIEGDIDVYLGIIPPEQIDESIFVRHLTTVEHGLILRADDPLAQKQKIDPLDLSNYSWVSFSTDPVTEKAILLYSVPTGASDTLIDIRTSSFTAGLQLVRTGGFVMSAPLQLARIIAQEGLVIRPSREGMPKRMAGVHVRKSTMNYAAIKSVLSFFDTLAPDFFEG